MNRLQNSPQSSNQSATQQGSLAVSEAELLPQEPPPKGIRWTAWLLIGIFVALVLVSVLVHIPDNGRCPFVLVPENGADPIQSPLMAVLQAVKVSEGQEVPAGAELFVLRSDEIWAWQTQLQTSEEDLRCSQKRSANLEQYFSAQMEIKKEEVQQGEGDVAF